MDIDITLLHNIFGQSLNIYRDENNNIIVNGDINVNTRDFSEFPIKIYKVNGNFNWYGTIGGGNLYSLKNFPDIVTGNVNISNNPMLISLNGCPKIIKGKLDAHNCMINDISDIATEIGGGLDLSNNPIENIDILEHIDIKGVINLYKTYWGYYNQNKITKIKDSSILVVEKNYYNEC